MHSAWEERRNTRPPTPFYTLLPIKNVIYCWANNRRVILRSTRPISGARTQVHDRSDKHTAEAPWRIVTNTNIILRTIDVYGTVSHRYVLAPGSVVDT